MRKEYKFNAIIHKVDGMDAAYIEFPYDVRQEFGKGKVLVEAQFDNYTYFGQLVKMKTEKHIIGIRKDIRKAINKQPGDIVLVKLKERQ